MRQNDHLWASLGCALALIVLAGCGGGSPASKDLAAPGDIPSVIDIDGPDGTGPRDGVEPADGAVSDVPPRDLPEGDVLVDATTPDAAPDLPADALPDLPPDALSDVPTDAHVDASPDTIPDVVTDARLDAVPDAIPDGSTDARTDNPIDIGPPPPCTPGTACDDRDPCTVDDLCDDDGICAGTLVEACDDGIDCTEDVCPTATECTHAIKPGWCLVEGTCFEEGGTDPARPCMSCVTALVQDDLLPDDSVPCEDGNPCTDRDHCKAGTCVGVAMTCDDSNPCTRDACVEGGACTHEPIEGPCDDASVCTGNDVCVGGTCQGEPVVCADDNPCTNDTCDARLGCVQEFTSDPCDDGNICTVGDQCARGVCRSGTSPLDCDDGNLCTDDGCVPTRPSGCVHIPNAAPCDAHDPCSIGDTCRKGSCVPGTEMRVCPDDGNICTDEWCQSGMGCITTNNSEPCDDGEPCFLDDVCSEGRCAPGSTPLACDDVNDCTTDSCEEGIGCVNRPNEDLCDDLNDCTIEDSCTAGVCIGKLLPGVCDDENECTGDFCRPEGGCGHKALPECRPQIIIDYPERAVTLDTFEGVNARGDRKLCVRGHIEYPKEGGVWVPFITINGRECMVSPIDQTFVCPASMDDGSGTCAKNPDGSLIGYPITMSQGFNPIVVHADSIPVCNTVACSNSACDPADCNLYSNTCEVCTTFADHVVRSFYYSPHWYDVNYATPESSMVFNGLDMFLGPEVWDDNDTSTPDDIATILTLFVQNMDIGSLIQNPVTSGKFGWCKYRVNLNHIRFGKIAVDLVPTWGGLNFKATIPNFSVDIDVPISGFLCPDFDGDASASSITIAATALLSMDGNGNPQASIQNPDVVVSGLDVDVGGIWGFLFNWIIDFFENDFASMIEEQFESTLANDIGNAIAGAIRGLALDQTFDLPAFLPGTNPLSLRMVAKPSTLDFTPEGGVVGMKATVVTPRGLPPNPKVLGSIGRGSCLGPQEPVLAFPKHGPLEIGLHDDFFNLIPYALYYGGGLSLPIDPSALGGEALDLGAYGISEMTLKVDFLLPPILSACNPTGKLMLQAGDVGVFVKMKLFGAPVSMQMYASLNSEARVFIQKGESGGNELALAINEPVFIDIEIERMDGGLVGAEDSLGKLIKETAIPLVLKALSGNTLASFPIPEIDLHAIAPQLPAGSKIAIDIRELLRITGNTVVSGEIK